MPTTRLTPRQLDVLRALAEPGSEANYSPGRRAWCLYFDNATHRVTPQIESLMAAGLIDIERSPSGSPAFATINDAGRAVVGEQG